MTCSKTTSFFISFVPHCSAWWGGDSGNPTGDWCSKCSEREGAFDVSTAWILPASSQALGLSDQSWSITAESWTVCQKKKGKSAKKKAHWTFRVCLRSINLHFSLEAAQWPKRTCLPWDYRCLFPSWYFLQLLQPGLRKGKLSQPSSWSWWNLGQNNRHFCWAFSITLI